MKQLKLIEFQPETETLELFKKKYPVNETVNTYEQQLLELFLIRNPKFRFHKDYQSDFQLFLKTYTNGKSINLCGRWFYFDWNKTLIHFLPEKEHLELRTARNKNLITQEEQVRFYDSPISIAGLSVGSHAALTIAMTGGAKKIKLADPDEISLSNLNRLRYGATVLGKSKAHTVAHLIAEINPYSEIDIYDTGINVENIKDFLSFENDTKKASLLIEGVDNLEMKILLREYAKTIGTPVIMATDNGDGIIVDVERYDQTPNLQLFNGVLGDFSLESFKNFHPQDLPKLATKVAGPNFIVPRMLTSLTEVGKTLYSWPQLGTAATFTGVVSAYLARAIINGKNIKSGKYNLNLESIFDADYSEKKETKERNEILTLMDII
ncbi:MAG: ThiF family adenylyltransferase [Candidatus Doudnabacteria bacterium]|jgi:molybdopterin/thiamine biosynthesis adenylyltransferase